MHMKFRLRTKKEKIYSAAYYVCIISWGLGRHTKFFGCNINPWLPRGPAVSETNVLSSQLRLTLGWGAHLDPSYSIGIEVRNYIQMNHDRAGWIKRRANKWTDIVIFPLSWSSTNWYRFISLLLWEYLLLIESCSPVDCSSGIRMVNEIMLALSCSYARAGDWFLQCDHDFKFQPSYVSSPY